jgi:L-malate glycosyltransferase
MRIIHFEKVTKNGDNMTEAILPTSKPIHVLHISTWHPVISGVSGNFIVRQCQALAEHGCRVGHIYCRIEGLSALKFANFWRGLPRMHAQVVPISERGFASWNIPYSGRWHKKFTYFILSRLFKRYIKERGVPDILHGHVADEIGEATAFLSKKYNVPYVITEHSSATFVFSVDETHHHFLRSIYDNASRVISVSPILSKAILKISPRANIRVVPNMVGEQIFENIKATKETTNVSVVVVGSLVLGKSVSMILTAIKKLDVHLQSRLVVNIVGDGTERANLEAQARGLNRLQVNFLGGKSHIDTIAIMRDCDFLVHASQAETFGIVLIEAMALGMPVVATRSGGPDAIVTPDVGLLVDVGDVVGLRDAIASVIHDIENWRAKSAAISDHARNLYHEDVVIPSIIEVYQNAIARA